jgi:transcriptional regulator of heat shock response
MNPRSSQILEAAIQTFIDTGEPVSSGLLYKEYDFGIKPAMIRLELDALEEAGYLEQPYHSAGRIPTDQGYEFYADRVLAENFHCEMRNAFAGLFARRAWPDLLSELSAELGLLSIALDSLNDEIYKTGLEALVNHLEWDDRSKISSVIRDFETMDEHLPAAVEKIGEGPQVFIGKKSPVTKSDNLSVVGGNYKVGDATISIFAIGPKRMDYKRTIRILRNL